MLFRSGHEPRLPVVGVDDVERLLEAVGEFEDRAREEDESLRVVAVVVGAAVERGPVEVTLVADEVRAEKGRVRELGNLAFHLSLLVLLFGIAGGKLFGYEGRVALVEGATFANVSSSYDALTPAPWANLNELEPLELTLDDFTAEFETKGARFGEPRKFEAAVSYSSQDEGDGSFSIRPNRPLDIDGTKFFLTGHGYAPELTLRDGNGDVAASGPTIFLPVDAAFTSDGVVKAPDARPTSLALQGLFLPTGVDGADEIGRAHV